MVTALEHAGSLHRPKICHIFDDAQLSICTFFWRSDDSNRCYAHGSTIETLTGGFSNRADDIGQWNKQQAALADHLQNGPARGARTKPGQLGHQVDQSVDVFGAAQQPVRFSKEFPGRKTSSERKFHIRWQAHAFG